MASTLSKRNQARNEQALQELLRSVPGNDRCADCQARNPGWASWSLGIFLCMRCAALHRKLGTHISKVKSLSMDAWTNEQVANMTDTGNVNANAQWNPQRKQPPIPFDADEVDSAMERFIRQKYEQKLYTAEGAKAPARSPSMPLPTPSRDTRSDSPVSLDDNPPPPPPKPGRKFGFAMRSASSGSFLSRSHNKAEKDGKAANVTSPKHSKGSRVFGATIGVTESDQGLEMKLLQLREMGFSDYKRNTSVLKGNGGDLERTIESLVRLGEGQSSSDRGKSSKRATPSEPTFPINSGQSSMNGATIVRSPVSQQYSSPASTPRTARSTNPFENQNREGSATSAFDAAMAKMSISSAPSQNQQSLFPNATGGHLASPSHISQTTYQHSMTPPVISSQYFTNNPYAQQPQTTNNPFMNTQPMSPMGNVPTASQGTSPNPFLWQNIQHQSVSPQQSTFSPQQSTFSPQQSTFSPQQTTFSPQQSSFSPQQSTFSPQQAAFSPQQQQAVYPQSVQQFNDVSFQSQQNIPSPTFQTQVSGGHYNPYQQQMQPVSNAPTGRLNKNSIMALYNQPSPVSSSPTQMISEENINPAMSVSQQTPYHTHGQSPQRSATMPVFGSSNPFSAVGMSAPNMPIIYQQQQYQNYNYNGGNSTNPFHASNT